MPACARQEPGQELVPGQVPRHCCPRPRPEARLEAPLTGTSVRHPAASHHQAPGPGDAVEELSAENTPCVQGGGSGPLCHPAAWSRCREPVSL